MSRRDHELNMLLGLVQKTQSEEFNCDEFLIHVPKYLDTLLANGTEISPNCEKVRQHLQVCPECLEEFDALLKTFR